jgi:hypothetical protein
MSAKRKRTMEDEDITQELFLDSSSEDKNMSHDSDSNQDESQQDDTEWRVNMQSGCGAPVIHRFTGGPSGIHHNAAPTINKDSTSLASSCSFF